MKQSIATLALLASLTLAGSYAHASNTVAGCPQGYVCTRTVETVAPICPTGYICRLNSSTSGTENAGNAANTGTAASTYVPGSYYNSYFGGLNSGPPNNNAGASLGGNQSWSTLYASTTATSTTSYVYSTSTPTALSVGAQLDAIIARAPTTWTTTSAVVYPSTARGAGGNIYAYYSPAAGQQVKSACGPGRFYNQLTTPYGCIDNFATNAPIVLNPAIPFDATGEPVGSYTITDPYCPGVIAREGIGSSQSRPILSTATGPISQTAAKANEGIIDPVLLQKQACIIGEAYKNQPYNNPWVTVNNLFGIVEVSSASTNFCKDSITLGEAKRRNEQQLSQGIHNDLYTSNSRLYVPTQYAFSLNNFESYFAYADHPGTNQVYWWNGTLARLNQWDTKYVNFYKNSDVKNTEFLALLNSVQFEQTSASSVPILKRCMDPGYVSNLLPIIGHYQSELIHDKKMGLIQ